MPMKLEVLNRKEGTCRMRIHFEKLLKSEWMNSSVVDMVTSLSHSCSAQKQKKNRKMWISPKIKSVITIFIICLFHFPEVTHQQPHTFVFVPSIIISFVFLIITITLLPVSSLSLSEAFQQTGTARK